MSDDERMNPLFAAGRAEDCGTDRTEPPEEGGSGRVESAAPESVRAPAARASRPAMGDGFPKPPYLSSILLILVFFPIGLPMLFLCFFAKGAHKAGNDKWAATFSYTAMEIEKFIAVILLFVVALVLALVAVAKIAEWL